MDCKIRMSKNALYLLTYAAIITKSDLLSFFGIGIYEHDKIQNARCMVNCKIFINPDNIPEFEEISKTELTKPIVINYNATKAIPK